MKYLRIVFELVRDAGLKWSDDKASMFAAALAYYTIFSLAPILVLAIAIASRVLRQANIQQMIIDLTAQSLGQDVANFFAGLLQGATYSSSGLVPTLLSIGLLIWGATGVFNHLKRALNSIWGIELEPFTGMSGVLYFLRTRLSAFLLVLGIGFLLIVTVLSNTILTILNGYLAQYFPHLSAFIQGGWTTFMVMLVLSTVLFAIIYRTLPDARIAWQDVWLGAVVTSLLFAIGNLLITLYLRFSSPASAYGAAGSLVVALLYIYYSAQIFFYGAEFTHVYANRYGSKVRPNKRAIVVRRQRIVDEPPPVPILLPEPDPLYGHNLPPAEPATRQQARHLGYGLLGLAVGLLIGFIASLKRDS
jgi:membrane protein